LCRKRQNSVTRTELSSTHKSVCHVAMPRLVRLPFRCGDGVSACVVREFVLWIVCGSGCRGYAASAAAESAASAYAARVLRVFFAPGLSSRVAAVVVAVTAMSISVVSTCRCKSASATGVPVGWVPVDVFITRGGASRDVAVVRVRSERALRPSHV
jgi:hypothetical protein